MRKVIKYQILLLIISLILFLSVITNIFLAYKVLKLKNEKMEIMLLLDKGAELDLRDEEGNKR